ncbi:branched-chain amino acid ABC transporter permease [Candidatus Bathyarchaeota archaeon]|nr:branched-chain amino acid ABC transporter permease [Candidatus Bathyarchaeota archaeon]
MEMTTELINTVWYACIYGLMAVPLTLSYRTSRVLNFAHGVYVTIGAYIPVLIAKGFGIKVSPILAVSASFMTGAIIAMASHAFVFSPLIKKKSTPVTLMIASMGLWIFIKYAFYAVLGTLQKAWMTPIFYTSPNLEIPILISFMGMDIDAKLLLIISLTSATFSLLAFFLTKTKVGMAIRAIADNPELAQITGISRDKTLLVTWAISGGVAAIGGFAWSLFAYVSPETGDNVILQVFACSVIGGLISLPITFVGSVIISSTENLLIVFLHRYLGVELSFRPFLSFFVLLLTILIRPPAGAGGGLPYRYRLRSIFRVFQREVKKNV